MQNEPFIMKSVERAREWVDAYALSTRVDKEESANVLAMLCGFGSWDVMVFAIESMPPTDCDETVGDEICAHRKEGYMHVFVCLLNIRPALAMFFISRLSPSASYPFTAFTMDDARADEAEKREQFLSEENQSLQDDDVVDVTDPVRLMTSARLCGLVNVYGWVEGIEYLGWDVDHESIDEFADNGEPSFDVFDDDIGLIPVYLSCLTRIPETEDDPSARLFMKACLGDFMMEHGYNGESQAFMILWQFPQHKEIGGKDYCCIGVSYSSMSESWKELLVSTRCDSPEQTLQLNDLIDSIDDLDGSTDCEDLVDEDKDVSCTLAIILAGFSPQDEPEGGWEIECETDTETGWSRLRLPELDETPTE